MRVASQPVGCTCNPVKSGTCHISTCTTPESQTRSEWFSTVVQSLKSKSLNKHLLQGPDKLNSLIGVLTHFWKEEVAFTYDIEEMFHNFNPRHRNFLRFLWFENNDLSGLIVEYKMDVHLFGTANLPGVGNLCLHQRAESNTATYGPPLVDELNQAKKLIIKAMQQHYFQEEIVKYYYKMR